MAWVGSVDLARLVEKESVSSLLLAHAHVHTHTHAHTCTRVNAHPAAQPFSVSSAPPCEHVGTPGGAQQPCTKAGVPGAFRRGTQASPPSSLLCLVTPTVLFTEHYSVPST